MSDFIDEFMNKLFNEYGWIITIIYVVDRVYWSFQPDIDLSEWKEEVEALLQNDVEILSKALNIDKEMAKKTAYSLGRVLAGGYSEIKKVGERYEFRDREGSGYFVLKDNKIDKIVLENVVLLEKGKILHTPKMDEVEN